MLLPDKHNEETDLMITRIVPVSPEDLFRGWTEPELMKKWFCPKPWRVTEAQVDLRPGGGSYLVMEGPNGEKVPMHGCYLEVVPNQKIVFTDTMTAGYHPTETGFFVGIVTFEKTPEGTRYTARGLHKNKEDRDKHESMGFTDGWNKALDQLVELFTK